MTNHHLIIQFRGYLVQVSKYTCFYLGISEKYFFICTNITTKFHTGVSLGKMNYLKTACIGGIFLLHNVNKSVQGVNYVTSHIVFFKLNQ